MAADPAFTAPRSPGSTARTSGRGRCAEEQQSQHPAYTRLTSRLRRALGVPVSVGRLRVVHMSEPTTSSTDDTRTSDPSQPSNTEYAAVPEEHGQAEQEALPD